MGLMRVHRVLPILAAALLASGLVPVASVGAVPLLAGGLTRQIASAGTTSFAAADQGAASGVQEPEFAGGADGDSADGAAADGTRSGVDRSYSGPATGKGLPVGSHKQAKSNPELGVHFQGLNFFNQRFANGGNQFSVEPPDQGLCAGNGFVVESVNDVLRVFHSDGTPATQVVDLNTFYGYPAAINRTTIVQGPFVTDPSCIYDQTTGHFIHVVLTLEVVPSGANRGRFIGPNHLDVAVSNTSDPTGAWTIYRIPVQDDGTAGTPDHHCSPAATPPPAFRTNPRACIGDYPHIGADRNGIYLETNEYDFFGDAYHGSQIYAISNAQLASLAASIAVTQFDTAHLGPSGKPGFTIWPAQTPGTAFSTDKGGTEYFLSSTAADEAQCDSEVVCAGTGTSNTIVVWALTNTSSLGSGSPALALGNAALAVNPYAIPPKSNQPSTGDWPQGQCLNIPTCAPILIGVPDPFNEVVARLDSNDTRMQQVDFANGKLWGALDTDVLVNGVHKAGIAYFIVKPSVATGAVTGALALQGTLALANNNLTYPAIGVTASGRGVMAFTLVGDDHYPSAAYAAIDAQVGAGDIHVIAEGVGLDDGFTAYQAQVFPNPVRVRWGDYGAAAVVGNSVWVASEYIAQSCTLAQYLTSPIGRCGNTRGALGNWSTHISQLTP
jgi:hypothetical protein